MKVIQFILNGYDYVIDVIDSLTDKNLQEQGKVDFIQEAGYRKAGWSL